MSYISYPVTNKCDNNDCQLLYEQTSQSINSDSMSSSYNEEDQTKVHTFTNFNLPRRTTSSYSNCKNNIHCNRADCSFFHPNGRLIDHNAIFSPLFSQQDTDSNCISSSSSSSISNLVNYNHQRYDSSQYDTLSINHSQTSSIRQNTRMKYCHRGSQCKRSDCYFEHPYNKNIDQVSTINNNRRINSTDYVETQNLIEIIDNLLLIAEEQLQKNEINDNTDDEQMSNIFPQDVLELKLQTNEFRSAINRLTMEYNSIVSLNNYNRYNVLQLQRIQKQLTRELKHWQSRLPIYAKRSDIIEKVRKNQVLIIKADTGSGKSTQIVQYLCDEHFADQKQIICTQPRKLAVRTLAARVAEEYGCAVGEEIGFQVGGGRSITSNRTKIKFVTDTLFLHEYRNNSILDKYSVVIVDEAHERKIDTDIVFGIMKLCLRQRKDLKLVIMSATLDMSLLYQYFAHEFQCETLEVGGRIYPIEDIYLDDDIDNYVQVSVTKAIEIHQNSEIGDILVFLTGQDEIDLALFELNEKLENDQSYIGLPLHGKLSEDENARIFEIIPNKRKIIFSTNVAETSITINGIKYVIDSGMVKEKMWDEKRKMQILKIGEITKSSVKQRRGRAGRTSAGKCYHLYTIETYESMDSCSRAEILCTQPTLAILKLKHIKITNIESFEWLESPSQSSLYEAHQTLIWLNALDSQSKLTKLGRDIAYLDIDPKLAVMLYKGIELNCLSYTLILAGMLTVSQNIWWTNKDKKSKDIATQIRAQLSHETGDHITLINIYLKWKKFCLKTKNKNQQYQWYKNQSLNGKSLQMADDFIREKSKQIGYKIDFNHINEQLNPNIIHSLLQCIIAGYFLNLAISNGPYRAGYQIISPFSQKSTQPIIARVFRTSTLCLNEQMPKYILFNELLNLNEINYITILSSINLQWLTSVSKLWYTIVNVPNLHTIAYENYTFENIGAPLLRAIVGKRNCNLNKLEDITQSIIDIDYKRAKLMIWSRQLNIEIGKELIKQIIEKEKEKLLIETEEIQIIGRTRILMSAGGICQMILIKNEFIRIILTKLPRMITEERIKDLCEPYGQIRKINFLRQNANGSCAAVTYTTREEACTALNKLNGYIEQGSEISVNSSCLKTDILVGKQSCRLKAIWYLTRSTGNGKIIFNQEKAARDACQIFKRLYYQCHYERSTNLPTLKIVYYISRNTGKAFINFQTYDLARNAVLRMNNPLTIALSNSLHNRGGSVIFKNIPKDFDEDDVLQHFQDCNGLVNAQVLRGRKNQKYQIPDFAEEDIKLLFIQYKSFQSDTVIINSNIINGKVEAYIEFLDINDLKQAIEHINGKIGLIGCGKVRLYERIQIKKENIKKNKEDEYIIKFHHLNAFSDKYDLIKILKDNQLYDNVKNVIVFRHKLNDDRNSNLISTNDLEEQEMGLYHIQSMLLDDIDLFNSEPNCQILSCTPDGTVTAIVNLNDPIDILTAIENYDNKEIKLFSCESKLRLIPSISHEIFINASLTKVISNQIQQVIQHIRDNFKRVYIKVISSTVSDKAPTMKIFINGDDIQQITMAKIEFDNLLKGIEYKFENDLEKTKILCDRNSTTVLQRIQNETGSYIWWDSSKSFVRIYGSDQSIIDTRKRIDKYIRDILKNKTHTITLDIPAGYVRQILKMTENYQKKLETEFNVEIRILVADRQMRITGKEKDVIKCEQIIKNDWLTIHVEQTTISTVIECPICYNVANYSLQACGHAYCLDCLRQEISTKFDTTLSNESLKIKCMMPQCDAVFLLRDIKTIIDPINMSKLARASFQAYLKTDTDIAQCMSIDCNQVYRKSEHPQFYVCESCLKMYCVKCEVEYHIGLTCDAYQALLKWKEEERPTMYNIGNLNFKPCPSCKQVIDRFEGCNAVKCKCGISFCWLCLKTDPIDIHPHFMDERSQCYNKCFTNT